MLPSNSLWQQIFTIFTLLLCRGVVENDRQVKGPLGGPPGGSQRSQNGLRMASPRINIGHFWTPWWAPRGPDTRVSLILLPLDRISVKTANTCYQSEFDGSKIEKNSRFWSISAIFGPFGPPCWAPRDLRSLSFILYNSLCIKSV